MEELDKKITEALNLFARQEIGNRLSEFAVIGLKLHLASVLNEYFALQLAKKVEGEEKE